jgi:hypothetical protein
VDATNADPGTIRASVIDQERTNVRLGTHITVTTFYGDDAEVRAAEYIGKLPDAAMGRYGLDVSVKCADCGEFHSPEAECED